VRFEEGQVFLRDDRASAIPFARLCREAFLSRVQLGDYGFYRTPGIYFDKLSGQGDPFFYFTQGVACSEVLIDRLTGELEVSRVELLMDLGRPINAVLDVGQVTGAFVQGMGWCTTENLVYDDKGSLLSHSPSTYKIPSIQDTPRVFDVKLVENLGNGKNVRGTKAVGEPPLLLSLGVDRGEGRPAPLRAARARAGAAAADDARADLARAHRSARASLTVALARRSP